MKCCEYPFFSRKCFHENSEEMIHGRFGNIIRAKGQLMVGEQYFQFGCRYSITGLDSKSMSKMVFIGDGLSKKAIYENFVKTDKYKKIKYKTRNNLV